MKVTYNNLRNSPVNLDYYVGAMDNRTRNAYVKTNFGFLPATSLNDLRPSWEHMRNIMIPANGSYTSTMDYTFNGSEPEGVIRVFGIATLADDFNDGYTPDDNAEFSFLSVRFDF